MDVGLQLLMASGCGKDGAGNRVLVARTHRDKLVSKLNYWQLPISYKWGELLTLTRQSNSKTKKKKVPHFWVLLISKNMNWLDFLISGTYG